MAIAMWLEENGWGDYFLDVNPAQGLAPGERWQEALMSASDRCEAVIVLVSPAWCHARWCQAEFLLAKQLGKKIVAALIEPTPLDSVPKELTVEWQLCDLVAGIERRLFRVRADPIVPDAEVSFAAAGLVRLKVGLEKAGLDASTFPWPPPHDPGRAPYRGLRHLDSDDAAIFFGREVAITRGLDALRHIRERGVDGLFVILGASGAGKSSYLRAGLWPRLARDDRHFLPLPVIRPQGAALTGATGLVSSLDAAFRKRKVARSRADIRHRLQSSGGLIELVSELQALAQKTLGPDSPYPLVLLPIDQGEELFVSEGREENEIFLAMLGEALAVGGGPATGEARRLVGMISIRSDSYDRLQSDAHLAAATHVPFNLSPIARAEFKSIITGPMDRAQAAGQKLRIDPSLTERLLQDAEGADALPLLAFVLERLYLDYGGGGALRVADYDALGGVRGSIEAAVEAAFADPRQAQAVPADTAERERLLRITFIPWLARVDPDTEERRRRIATWEEIPVEARGVVERLIAARLLVRDRRAVEGASQPSVIVEVAHEALLRQWPALTRWLDDDADALKAMEAVRRAASEWARNRRDDAWLTHTGDRLHAAETRARRPDLEQLLGDMGREYLSACRRRDQRTREDREAQIARISVEQTRTARAQRLSKWLLASVAAVLVLFSGWIVIESRAVARERSRVLMVAADEALNKRAYDRALRFAVLAAKSTWLSPAAPDADPQLSRAAYRSLEALRMTYDGPAWAATFSPDGLYILAASADKTARVSDAQTGREIARVVHDGLVVSVAFSPDTQRIVTAGLDRTARVSDTRTGKEIFRVTHDGSVLSAAFSPDGHRIVTVSADDTVRVCDAQSGREVTRITEVDGAVSAAFSPDSRRIVIASAYTASVYDAETREKIISVDTSRPVTVVERNAAASVATVRKKIAQATHADLVGSVALRPDGEPLVLTSVGSASFSPNGERILVIALDDAVIFDARTGKEIRRVNHNGRVVSAAFSPDGLRIVTGSWDKAVRVSDVETGEELARIALDDDAVAAGFSPDGRRIVSASWDKAVRISDAQTGQEIARVTHDDVVRSAAFSPDGQRVVTASEDNTVRVFNTQVAPEVARLAVRGAVGSAAFTRDGQRIVTATIGTVLVSDARTGKEIVRLPHDDAVGSAAFSPDGQRIVTVSANTARVLDAHTGKEIARIAHDRVVASAAFSPDGQRVMTLSGTGAGIFDAQTGKQIARVDDDGESAGFSRDGRRVMTVAGETVRISDAQTGQEVTRIALDDEDDPVVSAAFSPDGQRVVIVGANTARISNAGTGKVLVNLTHDRIGPTESSTDPQVTAPGPETESEARARLEIERLIEHNRGISAAALFSPDGRRVVTQSAKLARIADAQTGKDIAQISHEAIVRSAAFSPDGRRVLTVSATTTRVSDAETGREIARLSHDDDVESAAWSPDGQRIVSVSRETARLWDAQWLTQAGRELIESVCQRKLVGASRLSATDVTAAPVLVGREGEDVCQTPIFEWLSTRFRH